MTKFSLRMTRLEEQVNQMERGPPRPQMITPDMSPADAAKNLELTYARYRRPKDLDYPMLPDALAQARNDFVALIQPDLKIMARVDYAFRLLMKWCPEIWDVAPTARGPQIGRLQDKLTKLGWPHVGWITNAVCGRLIDEKRHPTETIQ